MQEKMTGIRSITFLALCFAGTLRGQSAGAERSEVVSVKPSNAGPSSVSGIGTGHGRLKANNVTLKRCIMGAYGVAPNQIVGGPEWLDSDRFEVLARLNDRSTMMPS